MLQDGLCLIRFNTFRHHIIDIHDHTSSQLQVILRLNSLLGDCLGDAFTVTTFKLSGKEIAEPSLQQRHYPPYEEEPYAPPRCPEPNTRSLTNLPSIEPVIDQVLQILGHSDLSHQAVFVPVHASQMTHMTEYVLQTISQLISFNLSKSVLNMRVNYKLHQLEYLPAQVERVAESGLLPFFRGQSFDRLQVKVEVQMQVI